MIQVNPLLVCREEFDGTGCLFNPEDGKVFTLNGTAMLIWRELEKQPADAAAVLVALRAQCHSLPADAESDVNEFLQTLQEKGYISLP